MLSKTLDIEKIKNYPGAELIIKGLSDIQNKQVTVEACLVLMLTPQFEFLNYKTFENGYIARPYNHRLYELLTEQDEQSAYSTYLALTKRLHSFSRCWESSEWASSIRST